MGFNEYHKNLQGDEVFSEWKGLKKAYKSLPMIMYCYHFHLFYLVLVVWMTCYPSSATSFCDLECRNLSQNVLSWNSSYRRGEYMYVLLNEYECPKQLWSYLHESVLR